MFRIMTNQTQNSVLAAQMQIGAVSYLNSRPLIEGLEGLLPSANLVLDYPSRSGRRLVERSAGCRSDSVD
jgi:hypothetical protein